MIYFFNKKLLSFNKRVVAKINGTMIFVFISLYWLPAQIFADRQLDDFDSLGGYDISFVYKVARYAPLFLLARYIRKLTSVDVLIISIFALGAILQILGSQEMKVEDLMIEDISLIVYILFIILVLRSNLQVSVKAVYFVFIISFLMSLLQLTGIFVGPHDRPESLRLVGSFLG